MFGQNFVQIFEIPKGPEFEYIYENSPELKVKLAKGNFTYILSSPLNLTCKGYETCYEGSITNNQLCLPTFNYKGKGEIPEAGIKPFLDMTTRKNNH